MIFTRAAREPSHANSWVPLKKKKEREREREREEEKKGKKRKEKRESFGLESYEPESRRTQKHM